MDHESGNTPKILITTSRNPSHPLRRAAKILKYYFASALLLNRGSLNRNHLLNYSINNRIYLLLILQQTQQQDVIEVLSLFISNEGTLKSFRLLISGLIDLKKHNLHTRIQPAPIKVKFSQEISANTMKHLSAFLKPLIDVQPFNNSHVSNLIQFRSEEDRIIKGKLTQNRESLSIEILHFTVTCDNHESKI